MNLPRNKNECGHLQPRLINMKKELESFMSPLKKLQDRLAALRKRAS